MLLFTLMNGFCHYLNVRKQKGAFSVLILTFLFTFGIQFGATDIVSADVGIDASGNKENIVIRVYQSVKSFIAGVFSSDNSSDNSSDDVIEVYDEAKGIQLEPTIVDNTEPSFASTPVVVPASNSIMYTSTGVTPSELSRELSILRSDLETKIRNAQRTAEIAIGNTRSYVDRTAQNVTNTTVVQGGSSDAGSLTGATLASNVLSSSLTSLGTIANLTATNATINTLLTINGLSDGCLEVSSGQVGSSGNPCGSGGGGGDSNWIYNSSLGFIRLATTTNNVAIGTTTPTATNKLSVAGNAFFTGDLTAANITATGTLRLLPLSNTVLAVDANGNVVATTTSGGGSGTVSSGLTGQVPYYAADGTTLTGTSSVFLRNGNFGIGTTSPTAKIHVLATDNQAIFDRTALSQYSEFIFSTAGVRNWTLGTRASNTGLYFNSGTNGSVNVMYMSAAGSVGIGSSTLASTNRLEVNGNGYFSGNLTAANITATGTLRLLPLSSAVLAVDQSGNVIATTTGGGGGSGTVSSGLAGQVPYYAANGTTLTGTSTLFLSNGNVGIGTTTPSAALSAAHTGNVIYAESSGELGDPAIWGKGDIGVFSEGNMMGLQASGSIAVYAVSQSTTGGAGVRAIAGHSTVPAVYATQSDDNGFSIFATGGKNSFMGSVGIGTTTPNSNLTVDGSFHTSCDNVQSDTTVTVDFSTAKNCLNMTVGSSNVSVTFTNANLVLGKKIEFNVIAPASGTIGSTTFSGGSGSGAVVPSGGVSPGNSTLNGSTDTFLFTSAASTTSFFIKQNLIGSY